MTPRTLAWIEQQKPNLVGWAEEYVNTTKLYEARDPNRGKQAWVSGSQLRNLLNTAQSGSSLAVLINFLRYQIGREKQGWTHRISGEELERLLREDLGKLATEGAEDDEADLHEVEAHLAAQLLGFVIREYTYRCALAGTRP